jgi:predicted O-methyltransferase YrrM
MEFNLLEKKLFCSGQDCLKNDFFNHNLKEGIITHASYGGLSIEQNPNILNVFNKLIGFTKPSRILEIGTFHGGLTSIMRDLLDINGLNKSDLLTYDVNTPNFLIIQLGDKKITVRTKNLFTDNYDKFRDDESKKELFDYINQPGLTIVLCDGGSKKNEFRLISSLLKEGDVIMAHDYAKNQDYFESNIKNKFWNWMEIQDSDINQSSNENNLNFLMQDEFEKVAWVCKQKS